MNLDLLHSYVLLVTLKHVCSIFFARFWSNLLLGRRAAPRGPPNLPGFQNARGKLLRNCVLPVMRKLLHMCIIITSEKPLCSNVCGYLPGANQLFGRRAAPHFARNHGYFRTPQ